MTLFPITTEAPFDLPDLLWSEIVLDALPHDPRELSGEAAGLGAFSLRLPDDLSRAVAKRRREFLAGRLVAAHALRRLGAPEQVGRAGRAPLWPQGVAGSISHDAQRAVAVVSQRYAEIGVDCEPLVSAEEAQSLAPQIFAAGDAACRPERLGFDAFFTLVFSAKEAFYKAVSARVGRMIEFGEVSLLGMTERQLRLSFEATPYEVHWRMTPQGCVTLCALGHGEGRA